MLVTFYPIYICRRFDLASFVFIQFIVSVPVLSLFGCSLIFHSYKVVAFVGICDICDKLLFTRVTIISCLKKNFKKTTTTTSRSIDKCELIMRITLIRLLVIKGK